jgi:predicted dehydrogenase
MSEAIKVGVIGCGNIFGAYAKASQTFPQFDIVACADLDVERARAKAEEYSIAKGCSVEEMLADSEIELVINLTIPRAHGPVGLQILEANKHLYTEKPLSATREEARALLQKAEEKGLRVGCAPDTFFGGGLQTCRKLIDDGWIGEPMGAAASMNYGGPESWHPDPEFFYKPGAGPMFDMGPYYLTALTMLLGPTRRVTGVTRITRAQRMITSKPHHGKMIDVEVPTYVTGIMDFASGPVGTIQTTFDVSHASLPTIEIYGTEGTLQCPDPNGFGGPVRLNKSGENLEIPLTHGYTGNFRGIGVADICNAVRSGRKHRANGELAFHVLDLMHSFHDSSTRVVTSK